jgi:hypothetical protein
MFAPTERLPRVGVLEVVPLPRAHGLLYAFEQVYAGTLGPSFYGPRTMVLTLLLCALPRFRRMSGQRLRRTEFRIGVRRLSIVQRLTNRQF